MAFVENKFEDHSHHESRRLLHLVFEAQGHMKSCCFEKIHENQFERQGMAKKYQVIKTFDCYRT